MQEYVFRSRVKPEAHLGTRQYARLCGDRVEEIGLN